MNLIGRNGVFNTSEDGAWGEKYAGKKCIVLDYDDEVSRTGIIVRFEDGQKLVIGVDEFTVDD